MWKLVARWNWRSVYGRSFSLGPRRPVGSIFWARRNPAGVAFNARGWSEAWLRADERAGGKVGWNLQGQRRSGVSSATAVGGRRARHVGSANGKAHLFANRCGPPGITARGGNREENLAARRAGRRLGAVDRRGRGSNASGSGGDEGSAAGSDSGRTRFGKNCEDSRNPGAHETGD